MGELNVSNIRGNAPNFTVNVEKDTTLNVESDFNYTTDKFPFPTGTTADRPKTAPEGAIRFNTDTNKLEVFHKPKYAPGEWCSITTSTDGTGVTPTITAVGAGTSEVSITDTGSTTTTYDLAIDADGPQTFTTSGIYTLEVNDLAHLKVELWGAGGGGASNSSPSRGAAGGYGLAYMSLEAGTYTFIVGQGGEGGGYSSGTGGVSGGYPDGGDCPGSYNSRPTGGAGGGSSRFGPQVSDANKNEANTAYYLIAGGGGGGSDWVEYQNNSRIVDDARGEGGGWEGGDGGRVYSADNNESDGGGGTQSAGGRGGTAGRNGAGTAGAKYQGGAGNGSGGGGGYYGGGGAGGYYANAGGGSGYVDTSVCKYYRSIRGGTGGARDFHTGHIPENGRPNNAGDGGVTSANRETARGSNGAVRISRWIPDVPSTDVIDTAGGDYKFDYAGYRYHCFINDGSFDFTLTNPATAQVEYLIVGGGGGGGGGDVGAGGGAGGFRTNYPGAVSGRNSASEPSMTITAGTYNVVVGNSGLGSNSSPSDGGDGGDSSFNGITSLGGGGGASWGSGSGREGGSGGGSVSSNAVTTGTPGQGYGGGNGLGSPNYPQGGGGGAGGTGVTAPSSAQAGPGGVGLQNPFGRETWIGDRNNRNFWMAGGGGGGVEGNQSGGTPGNGGKGGGGVGGRQSPNLYPGDGLCNTGSGGGGEDNLRGGYGGKGVVILRIKIPTE